jgi:hypothetical protein
MSFDIPVSFVQQFSANVHLLAEQRYSRLRGCVMVEPVTGESWAVETMGGVDAPNQVTTRHGDTPLNSTPHARRWGYISDYDVADLIDKPDRAKLLIDPTSYYTMRHAGTMGRGVDDAIIAAATGAASTGHTGTGSASLSGNQVIADGSVGLTIDKLMQAKQVLDQNEVDEFYTRYWALSAKQLRDLLNDDKVTSADFNVVQALVQGKVDTFMGFKFVRTERLAVPSASVRRNFAWAQQGIRLGIQAEPSSSVDKRPDKRNSMQIYTAGSWGAVRVEDKMVVQVDCSEA